MRLSHYKTAIIVTMLCAGAGFACGTYIGKSVRAQITVPPENETVEDSAQPPAQASQHLLKPAEQALTFSLPLPEFYTNVQPADLTRGSTILVNKFNQLPIDYVPQDLVAVNANQWLTAETAAHYEEMMTAAAAEADFHYVVTSGYRSYQTQSNLYNGYIASNGFAWAETWSARPGFSEHQTGLAMDIVAIGTNFDTFGGTPACAWLAENAHRFGFILRFPAGKEHITGYSYESWHYRYLGVELATKVKNSGLTYDQYYAAFLQS